jgi:pimeloyl-ACP methyl ester carboxylesterase
MRRTILVGASVAVAALVLPATGVAVAAPSATPAPSAPAGSSDPAVREPLEGVPAIEWGPCDIPAPAGTPPVPENYRCAVYPVPLDWSDPDNGETVDLALVKRPAGPPVTPGTPAPPPSDAASAPLGSLFVNPGGPSGSGVQFVALAGEFLFPAPVLESYDLVGFDPRFTNSSEGLQCFTGTEDPDDYFSDQFLFPQTPDEIAERDRLNANLEATCAANDDRGRDFMSTTDVARDLAQLHLAVGDPQLNFVGFSYGTLIASYFANLFPDRVGAVVADGVVDPQAYATGYTAENPPLTGEVDDRDLDVPTWHRFNDGSSQKWIVDEFLRLCEEAGPERCAFAPGAAERYDALLAALDAEPVVTSFPDGVVTDELVRIISYGTLYNGVLMPQLAEDLAYFEAVVAEQQPASVARIGEITRRATAQLPVPTNGQEQYWGVICGDGRDPNTVDAWVDAADESFEGFGPYWAWADAPCEDWLGLDADRYEGPWDARTANPVLVVSPTYDPATPYENAIALSQRLSSSSLLTVEGWNHTALGLSACGDEVIATYLLTRQVPAEDVTCAQELLPFGVPAVATPVDEVGTPVVDAARSGTTGTGSGTVDSEAEVAAIAEAEAIPGELVAAEIVAEVVERALDEDQAARHLRVAALDEARDLALDHDAPEAEAPDRR